MIGAMMATLVYVGCYTDAEHPLGLRAIEADAQTGALALSASHAVDNPLYLAWSPDRKTLYANCADGLAAFRPEGKGLTLLDTISLEGRAMCHVSVAPDGKHVFWAAYSNGKAGAVKVEDDKFGAATIHETSGQGPNLPRQGGSHPHSAIPTPDGRGYSVVDLGLDTITTYYPSEPARTKVFHTQPAGAGPRHLLYHPNGRLAFVIFELWNLVAVYEWDDERGFGRLLNQTFTLASQNHGRGENRDLAAALRFTPDGKHLVVSNRGEQSLVTYAIDDATGKLTFKARSILDGNWPRDFIFVDETLVLVALERSDKVVSLRYDAIAGTFTKLSELGGFFRPVALLK